VAARKQKQKRMSAQVVEDEECQLRYEVAAGVDVAKESAVVCVRMPPAAGREAPDVAPADGAGDGPGDHGARGGAAGSRGADGVDGGHAGYLLLEQIFIMFSQVRPSRTRL
jgi:hypothetical protein